MKIDGNAVLNHLKAFTDSYTQYNANGIGVSITNGGYAQIVSLFTINSELVCRFLVVDNVMLQTLTLHLEILDSLLMV